MEEDEFEFCGITFIAVDSPDNGKCTGCAFQKLNCKFTLKLPTHCSQNRRYDSRDVIFVKKEDS